MPQSTKLDQCFLNICGTSKKRKKGFMTHMKPFKHGSTLLQQVINSCKSWLNLGLFTFQIDLYLHQNNCLPLTMEDQNILQVSTWLVDIPFANLHSNLRQVLHHLPFTFIFIQVIKLGDHEHVFHTHRYANSALYLVNWSFFASCHIYAPKLWSPRL
jgi:hypothetical protein